MTSDRLHLSPGFTLVRLERRSPDMEIRNPRHHCGAGEARGSNFLRKGQITSLAVFGNRRANLMCSLNANGLDVPDKQSVKEENGPGGEPTSKRQWEKQSILITRVRACV